MPATARWSERVPSAGLRVSPWVTAATVALLAVGFTRRRYAEPVSRDSTEAAAKPEGRGRRATAPSDIPLRGWKDIFLRVYGNISEHRVMAIAAGVTFYALLAIFPAIAALVSLYGLFADPSSVASQLNSVSGVMPGGATEVLRDQMTRVASHGGSTLGLALLIGLATSLWSSNAGTKALFDALNVVYGEKETRSFLRLNIVSLTFTLAGIAFALLAVAAIIVLPTALRFLSLGGITEVLFRAIRWPILLVLIALALAFIYRYGPSRTKPQWRWINWGGAFAAAAWLAASGLFSWYAANFGTYNKTYGSLGAVVGFMIWIWLSTTVILIGAEIDAETEHQTARDTTVGARKPLGARGARVADTVGSAQD